MYKQLKPPIEKEEAKDLEVMDKFAFASFRKVNNELYLRFNTGEEVLITKYNIVELINTLSLELMIQEQK